MYNICDVIEKEYKDENYNGCMAQYSSLMEAVVIFKLGYKAYAGEKVEGTLIEKE